MSFGQKGNVNNRITTEHDSIQQLLVGNWEIEEMYIKSFYDRNPARKNQIEDSCIHIQFTIDSLKVSKSLFRKELVFFDSYKYELQNVDNEYWIKYKFLQTKRKAPFEHLVIEKANNSQLVLSNRWVDVNDPFIKAQINYYHFRKIDSDSITEQNFIGKWFVKDTTGILFNLDTIILYKDSCSFETNFRNTDIKQKNSYSITFSSSFNAEDIQYLSHEYTVSDVLESHFDTDNRKWYIKPKDNLIFIESFKKGIIEYKYEFKERELILIKKSTKR
jgi:hypothetical protein